MEIEDCIPTTVRHLFFCKLVCLVNTYTSFPIVLQSTFLIHDFSSFSENLVLFHFLMYNEVSTLKKTKTYFMVIYDTDNP